MALNDAKDYPLDNDDEPTRLANNHDIFKAGMGGKLVLAPLDLSDRPCRILDSGTADGLWLRDLRSTMPESPKHEFVGTDINPRFLPDSPPPDMTFQIQNVNEAWPQDWQNSFDFVHQRLVLAGAGPAANEAVGRICGLVKPGGWIQLMEAEPEVGKDDGPAMQQMLALVQEVFRTFGTSVDTPRQMAGWVREAGFQDVEEKVIDMDLGAKNSDPDLARKGIASSVAGVRTLAAFAKALPDPQLAKRLAGELDTLVPRLQAELTERGACFPQRIVWGRKPL